MPSGRLPASRPITERDVSLTFAKGMAVLKAFDTGASHLTLPQIARATGIDRAATRRLVLTLVQLGYVRQEERLFSLTPRVLVLAAGFLQARRFGKTVEPVLRAFAGRVPTAISMAMVDATEAVYVAHSGAAPEAVSIGFTVGSRVPLLHTAIGRALIAASPEDRAIELITSAPVTRHTERTVLDRDDIAEDIARTVACGHAFVDGEFEAGMAALAVPVAVPGGEPAALGMSANRDRFEDAAYRLHVIDTLRDCAKAVAPIL